MWTYRGTRGTEYPYANTCSVQFSQIPIIVRDNAVRISELKIIRVFQKNSKKVRGTMPIHVWVIQIVVHYYTPT